MQRYSEIEHINIGSGEDLTIADLAARICRVVGFSGDIVTDPTKPDGTPRKLMSGEKLRALGWEPRIGLDLGLADAHKHYLDQLAAGSST
jgi:GDP-L-fucose synthase